MTFCSSAQKISYDLPKDYENVISAEAYRQLVDLSIPIIAKRYAIDEVQQGEVRLKAGQEMQLLNLHNLILKYVDGKDAEDRTRIVKGHFENVFFSIDAQKKIDLSQYEQVKQHLSLRIYPEAIVAERGGEDQLVTRKDLEGTVTVLMLDLPGAFTPISREAFLGWKQDVQRVFAVAQDNINKQAVEKVTKHFDIDGSSIEISFIGHEDYAGSYALDLQSNSPELVGEWGTVLAIPNKGLADLCKVSRDKPLDFVKFIQQTLPLTEQSYKTHEQPISDQYFWYYKGVFTRINIVKDAKGAINVISPVGLTELMTKE